MADVLLFDVDKTLIKTKVGHTETFFKAFKEIYGVDANIDLIEYQGKTDKQIIIDVLKLKGLSEEKIRQRIDECMAYMVKSFREMDSRISLEKLEGVEELLNSLEKKGYLIGVVTGNIEEIGIKKLEKVGLDKYFKFGGFGNYDENRTKVLKIALKKAKKILGPKKEYNVFYFGDTPCDIKAGLEAGITTIGVATGDYNLDELNNSRASFVFENLKNKEEVLKVLNKNIN